VTENISFWDYDKGGDSEREGKHQLVILFLYEKYVKMM